MEVGKNNRPFIISLIFLGIQFVYYSSKKKTSFSCHKDSLRKRKSNAIIAFCSYSVLLPANYAKNEMVGTPSQLNIERMKGSL